MPNVVWILCDQLRAQALGHRGDPNVRTPHLDRLAARGVRFDQAVSGAPWCCPFRAAVLTGRYPHQVGVTSTPGRLDPVHPTLARPLREAGYHTAWVGKWHLGGSNDDAHVIPPECRGGFDYWAGFETGNHATRTLVHGDGFDGPTELPGFQTDALTELFLDHLGTVGDRPFFAALSVRPPHDDYTPPAGFDRHRPGEVVLRGNVPDVPWVLEKCRPDLAGYYGLIENLDHNVGRVLDGLDRLGIAEETYVVFFSDHGDSHGSHAMFQKSNPYEESIRIPLLIAKAGGDTPGAGQREEVLNHVDITAMTLGLCGVVRPGDMSGVDPFTEATPDSAYLQQVHAKRFPTGIDVPWRGVVTRDGWKLICTPGRRWLMFDLNSDPLEQANLAFNTRFIEQRRRLHGRLVDWIERTDDTFDPGPAEG
jgi:arylsulfatase A-like enzyme